MVLSMVSSGRKLRSKLFAPVGPRADQKKQHEHCGYTYLSCRAFFSAEQHSVAAVGSGNDFGKLPAPSCSSPYKQYQGADGDKRQ